MDEIDRIRAFNRFYTGWLGILDRSYLDSGMALTEVRVLHDLATLGRVTARNLADALHLDEGYLSRMLARFEKRGWVSRQHDARDRRRRHLALTPAGRAQAEALMARSQATIERSIADLGPVARADMVAAMGLVQATLSPAEPGEVAFRDLEIGDAGWVASRHAVLYAADEGYDATFEALVARLLADFVERRDPATERAFIPVAGGVRLGAVFCVRDDPETARLRMFFLEPFARGLGLGRRMLEEVVGFATATGAKRLVLWTHESHRAACRLYAARGFVMKKQQPARAFGQDTIEQVWELAL